MDGRWSHSHRFTPFGVTLHHPAIAGKVLRPRAQRRAGVPPLMFAGVDGVQGARCPDRPLQRVDPNMAPPLLRRLQRLSALITRNDLVFQALELDLVKTARRTRYKPPCTGDWSRGSDRCEPLYLVD